ncbi:MAG: ABC transporter permease [Lachnospiraceae bacterium]|nr:ABC transporter permease [Lachnospiraceae bacterium]
MTKYEIKKVFLKTGSKISILILLGLLAMTCRFAMGTEFTDESGVARSGKAAVLKLKAAQKEWAGILDEEKLKRVIEENNRINETPQGQSKDYRQNNIAYGWKQGFREIRWLINYSFADHFRESDYYKADSLKAEDMSKFYVNRIRLLKEWLEGDGRFNFSDAQKAYLIKQYEDLETPFYYDYLEGWSQLFLYSPTVIMITMLVLGYLLAGIFANEFTWKADAIFFSSMFGRNKAVSAKIKAGFNITTVIYLVMMFLYSAVVLMYHGIDGWNCPVQAGTFGWKCFYNIKVWQEYLLIIAGGYIGCVFIAFLTMWVSAKTRSAVLSVMVPFVIIFIPSFMGNIDSNLVNKILGLMPDRLLQVNSAVRIFDLYELGGKVVGAIPILFVLYGVLAVVFIPVIYREYRFKQVK